METNKYAWMPLTKASHRNIKECEVILQCGEFKYRMIREWASFPKEISNCIISGVACDNEDNVYIACRVPKYPIAKFDLNGNFIKYIGVGMDIGRAHGISLTKDKNIWLSDDKYHVARLFNQDGECIKVLGNYKKCSDTGFDSSLGHNYLAYLTIKYLGKPFNKPTKVIEATDGKLYASDGYGNAAIHVFSNEGELINSWGGPGQLDGEFNIPHSVCVDKIGRIWVTDRDNNRVQIFDKKGKHLKTINGLLYPAETWISKKYAYIAEMDGRISIYNMMNFNLVSQLGYSGSLYYTHSITGDSNSNLYLGLFGEYTLVKLERI